MEKPPIPESHDPDTWTDEQVLWFHRKLMTAIAADAFMETLGIGEPEEETPDN